MKVREDTSVRGFSATVHGARAKILLFSLMAVAFASPPAQAYRTITANEMQDKMRGMWLGQLIGNAAGRPTEGHYWRASPDPRTKIELPTKEIWDADDDTDIEYVALDTLETCGFGCNSVEIAEQWRRHITPAGIYIANKQAWFLMGDGVPPPYCGSRTYNEHWYAIDSQISTETLGALCPGLPQAAITLSGKFARITNTGFPVHAAQFYAAMYANAFFEPNVVSLVHAGLRAIPETSRTHKVITDMLTWYQQDLADGALQWRDTRQLLYENYVGPHSLGRYYTWVESTVNAGATVMAILYGRGDFHETVRIGVLAGWDCDCNPATAGGLIGIIKGFSGLPPELTDPANSGDTYRNVYRPGLPDPDAPLPQSESITGIAARMAALAEQNIWRHGGTVYDDGHTRTYFIPHERSIIPERECPDPPGPAGLVGQALAQGVDVHASAAVARYNHSNDRYNLDAIADGVTDNSYNGHRPYFSFVSSPSQRPELDFYQLEFSQPVLFDRVIFHEGDIVWGRINEYYRTDQAKGGYFEDLTVQVRRDGRYITPADLVTHAPLDRFRMYQQIAFYFAPTVGDAVRIIGKPGGTQGFTTILELEAFGQIDPGLYVAAVTIADGRPQRSRVDNIQVAFSEPVTITKQDVVLLAQGQANPVDPNTIEFYYDGDTSRLYLFFPDPLPDGRYELALQCDQITNAQGRPLLDDDSNPHDGSYSITFHSLFGDADGSAHVDFADLSALASYWLGPPSGTGLDANADDRLDLRDLAAFSSNWRCDP